MFQAIFGDRSSSTNKNQQQVGSPDYNDLSQKTLFSVKELKKLNERFITIAGADGLVTCEAFCCQPEVASCRLIIIAFAAVCPPTSNVSGIEFSEFVAILSKFSPRSTKEEKAKCKCINIYINI